ncbi:MAG: DNA polymerase III subunit delta [Candidatus Symbiothrix sp.]|nr:DNA polymerase III subunit delta [Candidatus Symbiothrix sp.]
MVFKNIIGHTDLKERLIKSVQEGVIPHARLFSGPEGAGALPLSVAYARYLLCTNRQADDACGTCPSCQKINKLAHPDLHFVFPIINKKGGSSKDALCDDFLPEWREFLEKTPYSNLSGWLENIQAGNAQGTIYARESNEIVRKLNFKSYESDYKIMIIWLPEKMQEAAANKLLKLLEEPPEKTVFLLVSEEPDKIITTIRSRCQQLIVPLISDENARQSTDETDMFLELFKAIMRNSWKRDIRGMKAKSEEFTTLGRDKQKAFLAYAQRQVRENFLNALNLPEINYMNENEADFAVNFHKFVNERNVEDFMNELALAERHIESNVNAKMVFFDLSMKIAVLLKK